MLHLDNPILFETRIEQLNRMAAPLQVKECKI